MAERNNYFAGVSPCVKCHLKLALPSICDGCGTPQPVSQHETFFSVFGLYPQFGLEKQTLTQRFYFQSRKIHPDRYVNHVEPQSRAWSVERMSFVNDALRVLSDRIRLRDYMFELFLSEEATPRKSISPLALEWFDVQEENAGNISAFEKFLERIKKEILELNNRMIIQEKKFNDEMSKQFVHAGISEDLRHKPEPLVLSEVAKNILIQLKDFQNQLNTLVSLEREVIKQIELLK